jgi:hypothetical protein
MREAFEQACERAGDARVHDLELGGRRFRLRFAGPALVPAMLPALSHLERPPAGAADTEVCLWDTASTGVGIPKFPWSRSAIGPMGEVLDLRAVGVRTVLEPAGRSLTLWDEAGGSAVFWTPGADRLSWQDRAAPLRAVLHWSMAGPRRHLVHAGVVGPRHGGVLLAGPSGSGKTTTALACVEAGMSFAGDDYVLVELEGQARALTIHGTAKMHGEALPLVPNLRDAPRLVEADGDFKAVIDLVRHRRRQIASELPLAAIVLPRVAAGRLRATPVPAGEALRALAPSTIFQHPHESAGGLAVMAELVRRLPAFELSLGDDPAAVPAAVGELLESLT